MIHLSIRSINIVHHHNEIAHAFKVNINEQMAIIRIVIGY